MPNETAPYAQKNENIHQAVTDTIALGNGESIDLYHFLETIKLYSFKAVNLLPVEHAIKQKILQEIGVQPIDNQKIKSIYKIGRQWISQKNKNNFNVYGECQPTYRNGRFSFIIAMENKAPKKLFQYFLYHEIDHMVGYLAYRYTMQDMGLEKQKILEDLADGLWELKTEFFARTNTANQAML